MSNEKFEKFIYIFSIIFVSFFITRPFETKAYVILPADIVGRDIILPNDEIVDFSDSSDNFEIVPLIIIHLFPAEFCK
jgi:hypothetical protein